MDKHPAEGFETMAELVSQKGYRGSYDTVKLFVRPLRAARLQAERALVRFEIS